MSTAVKSGLMVFPYSLGKVGPAASFASLSVPLTQNILPVMPDGSTPDLACNEIEILALPGNTGIVYVCNSALAPDTTNYTNILFILNAADPVARGPKEWSNCFSLGQLWIGASDATSFALVSFNRF